MELSATILAHSMRGPRPSRAAEGMASFDFHTDAVTRGKSKEKPNPANGAAGLTIPFQR